MRLYIIRHGDPDYAIDHLTEAGKREAAALAERLAGEGLTHLFSSPLGRARATLAYTSAKLGMEGEILPWTKELSLNAAPPGKPHSAAWDVPGETIRSRPVLEPRWRNRPRAIQGSDGKNLKAVWAGVRRESDAFLARFGYVRERGTYRIQEANRHRLAIFCHGGFGLTWLAHLLDLPLAWVYSGFFLPPTSVTTILFDERSSDRAVPRCLGLGDISHLHMAGLPMSTSGIKANTD